jgi:hypothetical protein
MFPSVGTTSTINKNVITPVPVMTVSTNYVSPEPITLSYVNTTTMNGTQIVSKPVDSFKIGDFVQTTIVVPYSINDICLDDDVSDKIMVAKGSVCKVNSDNTVNVLWMSMTNTNTSQRCRDRGLSNTITWNRKDTDELWNDKWLGKCSAAATGWNLNNNVSNDLLK